MRFVLPLLTLLIGLLQAVPAGARIADIPATSQANLTDFAEWCVPPDNAGLDDIVGGGCAFTPLSSSTVARGFMKQAVWLRLTLHNPGTKEDERWLTVGHPRIQHVAFYTPGDGGDWVKTEVGLADPPNNDRVHPSFGVTAYTLAPGETRTVLIRLQSQTFLDLTPVLWRPYAYTLSRERICLIFAISAGGLLISAIFCLAFYYQWKDRSYLYFSASEFLKSAFLAFYSNIIQSYLWPFSFPFDMRLLLVTGSAVCLFYVLFILRFIPFSAAGRKYRIMAASMAAVTVAAAVWGCAVNYSTGIVALFFFSVFMALSSIMLCFQAWRAGFRPAGFMVVSCVIFIGTHAYAGLPIFAGLPYSDATLLVHMCGFIVAAPTALLGIADHRDEMRRRVIRAEAEARARVDFVARMSHELRAPLDTILGTVQLMERGSGAMSLADGLAGIRDSGRHLLRLINDILDHARILAGKLAIMPAPVDWSAFLEGVRLSGLVLAGRNGNTFSLVISGKPPADTQIDESRLRQVLDNLLSNAARHTENGAIRIDCVFERGDVRSPGAVKFVVADSGEGIPLADQARIFLPFERGSASSGGRNAGMGLAISRQIVELMGGRLTVESVPGQGARFSFRILPVCGNGATAPQAVPRRSPAVLRQVGGGRTAIVADDDAVSRRIAAMLLREIGFAVREAASGEAAVAILAASPTPVSLVVTDQYMDDGNGWWLLRELSIREPDLPVILISAAPPDRPSALPGHVDFAAILLKPLDHEALIRCVDEALGPNAPEPVVLPGPAAHPLTGGRPNDEDLARLRELIDGGQVTEIMVWANDLRARAPHCAAFAGRAEAAARHLDFSGLTALLSESETGTPA